MRGVEAAPLTYVIAAIAVVIALSILVLMGGTVRKGVSGATETLNKSITAGAKRIASEMGELYSDVVEIDFINKTKGTVIFVIYDWKNVQQAVVSDQDTSKQISIPSECSNPQITDKDQDGKNDDLICNYTDTGFTNCNFIKVTLDNDNSAIKPC